LSALGGRYLRSAGSSEHRRARVARFEAMTQLAPILLLVLAACTSTTSFDEITVGRINVVERDGRLRMVVSNTERSPGIIVKGVEHRHPNPSQRGAGLVFFNDEATENGGLVFGGKQGSSGGGLSFDQYEQDQVVQLLSNDEPGRREAGIRVWDRPDRSILDTLNEYARIQQLPPEQQNTLLEQRKKDHYDGATRMFAGKDPSGSSVVSLSDGRGQVRLRLRVTAAGDAAIEFLDASGAVVKTVGPSP
jgi:hypothetical protein